EIVGLVADAKYQNVRLAAPPTVYFPYTQAGNMPSEFALRTSVPPAAIVGDVRRAVEDVMRAARLRKVTTLGDQVDASIVPERLIAVLSGLFGAIAAL